MNDREQMLTSILKCRRVDLTTDRKNLTPSQQAEFGRMVKRRAQGEPLQYIIGHCDFMGIDIAVDPRVLIPRPETELLVDQTLHIARTYPKGYPLSVLDLGTGSGNIAITLIKNISGCTVTAVDSDGGAIDVAKANARAHKIGEKLKIIKEDMGVYLQKARHWGIAYDLIISNPPYIPEEAMDRLPEDVQQEPAVALNGGKDGLDFYRLIIPQAHHVLKSKGYLFLELGDGQLAALMEMFSKHPQYASVHGYRDYVGTKRFVAVQKS